MAEQVSLKSPRVSVEKLRYSPYSFSSSSSMLSLSSLENIKDKYPSLWSKTLRGREFSKTLVDQSTKRLESFEQKIAEATKDMNECAERVKSLKESNVEAAIVQHYTNEFFKHQKLLHNYEKEKKSIIKSLYSAAIIPGGLFSGFPDSEQLQCVSSLSVAPSSCKLSDIEPKFVSCSIYHHYIAVELWNYRSKLLSGEESFSESCLKLADAWENIGDEAETTRTARLSWALNHFINGDWGGMCCLHRCEVRNGYKPDFLVLPNHTSRPEEFLAIADYKTLSIEKALVETAAYSLLIGNHFAVRMAFACTKQCIVLELHFGLDGRVGRISLERGSNKQAIQLSLSMLKHGIALVRDSSGDGFFHPTKAHKLRFRLLCCYKEGETLKAGRIFKNDEPSPAVIKLYDTQSVSCNLKLTKLIFKEAELISLTSDGRFQMLKYTYRSGSHIPRNVEQIVRILDQLSQVHKQGYVHGDIRAMNCVFSSDSNNAWLIDFDLADQQGTLYPVNYRSSAFPERHQTAVACKPRRKIHDVFALGIICKDWLEVDWGPKKTCDEAKSFLRSIT